jgi:hypothetical protein
VWEEEVTALEKDKKSARLHVARVSAYGHWALQVHTEFLFPVHSSPLCMKEKDHQGGGHPQCCRKAATEAEFRTQTDLHTRESKPPPRLKNKVKIH